MGPFLEQKASVGFWKFRPRGEVHTQGQCLVCRALVRSGPSSQREGTRRQVRLGVVGRRQRQPQTQGRMKGLPGRAQIPQRECRPSEAPRIPALQLGLHTDMPATGVPPCQLLNQHSASWLSMPQETESAFPLPGPPTPMLNL